MKDLKFLCVQPQHDYYIWQVHAWIESLRKIGHSNKAIILIFIPQEQEQNKNWDKLINLYPESEFTFIKDTDKIRNLINIYISSVRPYTLMKYFREHPEMSSKAIFYCDCDILFTEKFNIDSYIHDDVNYLSDTNSYINADYFDSKIKDVLPNKLEDFKKRDVLEEVTNLVGTSREIAVKNNLQSGGAQYLLKNIDADFWEKVLTDCIKIKLFLITINMEFFENENKGFQSFCADMWAVLWNIWSANKPSLVIPEMKFTWGTNSYDSVKEVGIYHNAGITSQNQEYGKDANGNSKTYLAFNKTVYHQGKDPFTDAIIYQLAGDEESRKHAIFYYVEQLLEIKEKYNLVY